VQADSIAALVAPRLAHSPADHLPGRTLVIFGGSCGIGWELRRLAQSFGADVFSFSRSTTGTVAEDAVHVRAALDRVQRAAGRIDAIVVAAGLRHRRGKGLGPRRDDPRAPHAQPGVTGEGMVDPASPAAGLAPLTVAQVGLAYLRLTHGQLLLYASQAGNSRALAEPSVVGLTRALAREWSGVGVRINCLNPQWLSCADVALASCHLLVSDLTGQVIATRASMAQRVAVPAIHRVQPAATTLPTAVSQDG
jgi:ribitol-5-phosphate 2-dehydrogenase (NADP+) / D-ribitol-5-phosphate cytidylyltransferase